VSASVSASYEQLHLNSHFQSQLYCFRQLSVDSIESDVIGAVGTVIALTFEVCAYVCHELETLKQ
jgi:hypothetical protein